MHVHREGSLDVALNNCIGAREGRRKVRARRHDEPIISPDVSARSPFNRPRPIEPASFRAPPHVLCFPTMLLSSCNPYIRACGSRVFKVVHSGRYCVGTSRYSIEKSDFE